MTIKTQRLSSLGKNNITGFNILEKNINEK